MTSCVLCSYWSVSVQGPLRYCCQYDAGHTPGRSALFAVHRLSAGWGGGSPNEPLLLPPPPHPHKRDSFLFWGQAPVLHLRDSRAYNPATYCSLTPERSAVPVGILQARWLMSWARLRWPLRPAYAVRCRPVTAVKQTRAKQVDSGPHCAFGYMLPRARGPLELSAIMATPNTSWCTSANAQPHSRHPRWRRPPPGIIRCVSVCWRVAPHPVNRLRFLRCLRSVSREPAASRWPPWGFTLPLFQAQRVLDRAKQGK